MTPHTSLRAAAVLLAAGLLLNQGSAAPRKELAKQVDVVAEALRLGKKDALPDLVKKASKLDREVEHYMQLFRSRKQQGFGVGKAAGAITPDSIEDYVKQLTKAELTADEMKKNADALVELGFRTAALAKISDAYAPKKDVGKKTKDRWLVYTGSMYEGGMDLVAAAQKGSAEDTRKAAIRINGNCNSCHNVFHEHHE